MDLVLASAAFVVAAMYAVIAVVVVPRLARAADGGSRTLLVARWGAIAFFVGCAVTHLGIGIAGVRAAVGDHDGAHALGGAAAAGNGDWIMLAQHVVPHVAQIVGGALFIAIASSHLEWTVMAKDRASMLRERETQFRAAFERNPVGVALIRVLPANRGEFLQVNPALRNIVGEPGDGAFRDSFRALFAPDDQERAEADLERLLRGEPVSGLEYRVRHREGHLIWVRTEASVVRDEAGALLFAVVLIRDISAQRRTDTLAAAQQAVAHVVADAPSVNVGVEGVIGELCRLLGWAGGEYFQTEGERDRVVRSASWWSPPFEDCSLADGAELAFGLGEEMPGTGWITDDRIWVRDLTGPAAGSGFWRAGAAAEAGLACAVGVPIRSGKQCGVIVLFATTSVPLDAEMDHALEAIAAYVGRFLEGRRAEDLHRLVEEAPDAVVITDGEGRIVRVNARTEQLFGYPREELLGEPVEMLVPERSRGVHPQRRAEYRQDPGVRTMGLGLEFWGRRKDGTEFPVEISLSPLETDAGLLTTSTVRDLTERRQAERLRFQLAAIVDSSDDAIIGTGPHGVITSWNPAAQEIFGYTEAEAIGRPLAWLLPPGREGEVEETLTRLRGGHRVEHHDTVRRRRDGEDLHVSVGLSAIRDRNGEMVGTSTVVRDITRRKHTEAALAAAKEAAETSSQAFEAFSYSVAHDLRAPLRSIDGFSHLLATRYASALDETGVGYLDRVRASAQNMARLIDGLLGLARVTHQDLAAEPVDLGALAGVVVERLRQESPGRTVDVVIETGLTAVGDPVLLANVVENLLANAWKFTREHPFARIEFGRDDEGYFVRDNGAGFDMAFSAHLFGVFQRLHHQDEFEGTGVGLATVQRIVRRHGGRIWAEGAPGQGATFHFTLAREPALAR